jgi:hypothetical protein
MSYNPYRKYCVRWWKFWLNMPSDVLAFLRRVWDYAPLLWEDRDWDQAYLLRLMRFKIRRMRASMEKCAIMAHTEDVIAEMARADVLLRNVVDEDPDDEWSQHYSQWDSHIKAFKDCKNQREHRKALKLSLVREEKNWHDLWKHLDKYLRGWWD